MQITPPTAQVKPVSKKTRKEVIFVVVSVLSFTLMMTVLFFDAAGVVNVTLWVLYSFLGLIGLVVYGLLLVLRAADKRLGVPYNFMTMVAVVLGGASLTFFGLSRLGDISGLAPIAAFTALLVFLLALKRSLRIK